MPPGTDFYNAAPFFQGKKKNWFYRHKIRNWCVFIVKNCSLRSGLQPLKNSHFVALKKVPPVRTAPPPSLPVVTLMFRIRILLVGVWLRGIRSLRTMPSPPPRSPQSCRILQAAQPNLEGHHLTSRWQVCDPIIKQIDFYRSWIKSWK